ncbi:septation ring formation regulator EzrA [Domibacillus epiphyticus]|uniref:Septation ring formation regulator EzrA n=1 Tax=Domibacillus epiphyticus TaxID=1714355 RepID=A0A1V2A9S1_9BACI|nr:septation ring formation regulator EzrA [Domibacillus epiphyticus]OMP67743.1 septation ring formation regulator EzrA [Domibacillus epiphyticus]
MEFVIGAIVVVLILFIYSMVSRKKHEAEIDRLDMKKTELLHRPVNEELTKVKRLNMTGQTEALFDRWRSEWDEIVTVDIPAIDEELFASEEHVDKFRFGTAKKTNAEIAARLDHIEQKVDGILMELDQLVGSEEKNRAEGEEVHARQREARKRLLAHRHTFGKAAPVLEVQLDVLTGRFDTFADLTEEGNYLEARELLMQIQSEMDMLQQKMDRIPALMAEVNHTLPAQLAEIENGYKEMKQDGYLLDHLQIEKEIAQLKEGLARCREFLMKTEVEETDLIVSEAKDSIEFFYDLLEKEVMAKHNLFKDDEQTGSTIENISEYNSKLIEETDIVKQSYQLNGEEAGVPRRLKEEIYHLEKQYEILHGRIAEEKTAYSFLYDELKDIQARIDEMKKEQDGFAAFLQTLRKDEVEAGEELQSLRLRIQNISRTVKQSNFPALPDYYRDLTEEASQRLNETTMYLNEKPLNMKAVREKLDAANGAIDLLANKTDELIEQVALSERMIQFGNRYRRTHPNIGPKLNEAELAFRHADYGKALELCAAAIDKVDSKGLKKFDAQYNEELKK